MGFRIGLFEIFLTNNPISLPRVKENLTFADTRVGLRCLELPEILDLAQESFLTSEPNPSYASTAIKVDELVCMRMLRDLGVAPQAARAWGNRLKAAADEVIKNDGQRPAIIEPASTAAAQFGSAK